MGGNIQRMEKINATLRPSSVLNSDPGGIENITPYVTSTSDSIVQIWTPKTTAYYISPIEIGVL